MNSRNKKVYQCCVTASVAAVLAFAWSLQARAQVVPPPVPANEEPEILTRGPVHEAFAEPVILESQVGVIAPTQPPEAIEEVPPTDRPAGDQFAWVPGYWSWDGERNSYIWISACWRATPPNMSWVPGYWSPATGGWEWVAGFWSPADEQEIEYLPAPPANEDVEAPGAPPAADNSWVPPCWYWSNGQYVQRPGYWLAAQPGWAWTASHYVWTPRGYVFAAGHWDYPLEDRGVLFAPVSIAPSVYERQGYRYSPTVVVDLDLMSASLFVSPRYDHYYYGDYYDNVYVQAGIFAWFDSDHMPDYYDPIYEYDRSRASRSDPHWDQQMRQDYNDRRRDVALRPPRTYRDMEVRVAQAPVAERTRLQVVQPLSVVVNNSTRITNITNNNQAPAGGPAVARGAARPASAVKFEKITPAVQTKIATQAATVKKLGNDRKNWETTAVNPKAVPAPTKPIPPVVAPAGVRGPTAAVDRAPAAPARAGRAPVDVAPAPARAGRGAVEVPPAVAKEPVVPESTPTAVAPAGRGAAAGRRTPVAPREVPLAQPERVKMPAAAAEADAKPARGADRGAPPKPANEARGPSEPKGKKDDTATSPPGDSTPDRGGRNGRGN